jgi:hypothetical protein
LILFVASLIVSFALGILLTLLLSPSLKSGTAARAVVFFAGGGLGLGLASCLFFICLAAGLSRFAPAIEVALALILGGACLLLRRKNGAAGKPAPPQPRRRSTLSIVLAGIFLLESIAWAVSFGFAWLREPHGRWDAWLIWNMHARFLYRAGDHWRDAFASGLDWSHWDYPLMLPLSIVRSWNYMGNESSLIPALIAALFAVLTLGLLAAALASLKGAAPGVLAAMVLMGTPFFVIMGISQFADVPLAFFILATFVFLALQARSPAGAGPAILAGFAAGLCAWTKNEGLLFVLIAGIAVFVSLLSAAGWKQALRGILRFAAGALPVLLILFFFKTQLSPVNDLMAGMGPAAVAAKLTDWGRYAQIAKAFFFTAVSFTQGLVDIRVGMNLNIGAVSILLVIAYLFLMGVRIDGRDRVGLAQSAAITGLMLIGYFFIYVLTPLDLDYHLATSLNRLFLQFWPGVIFLAFLAAGTAEGETTAGAPGEALPQGPLPPEKGAPRLRSRR